MVQPIPPKQSQKRSDAGKIPGPAAVPNVVELILTWQLTTLLQARVTLHGQNNGTVAVNQALANTLFSSLGAAWVGQLGLYVPTSVSLIKCTVRDMTSVTNPSFDSTGSPFVGTSASPLLPTGVALVLTENVAVRGRGAKGRLFIPGFATNADAGGGLANDAVRLAMNSMGSIWMSNIQAANLVPAVAKPARFEYFGTTGTHHNARPASFAPVTSYVCRDDRWDSQRRRGSP